jgi:WD40 repeat protein
VATASGDGTIKIWDVETGLLRITLPARREVLGLAYSPDGRYLAAIGPGFVTVYMLDIEELIDEARSRLTRWWTESECAQHLDLEQCPPAPESLDT